MRYKRCLERALAICELQGYLAAKHTEALDTTDMLRSAVVLCVSAFDFLLHEVFRVEVAWRYRSGRSISRLLVPFDLTTAPVTDVEFLLAAHVKEINSYKSFVDPGKYSEAMGCFVNNPWERVSAKLNHNSSSVKQRVRLIYRWRNRIAHEADVNPVLAGVELWPIEKQDVVDAISDIKRIGLASVEVIREG